MKGWTSNNTFNYDGVSTDAPKPPDEGLYKARFESAEPHATKEGKPMIKLSVELFEDANGDALSRKYKITDNVVLSAAALFRVKILSDALDIEPIAGDSVELAEEWCKEIVKAGSEGVFVKVKHETYIRKDGSEGTAARVDRYLNPSKVAAEASASSNGASRRPRRGAETAQA